mmetsp:Transcript_30365/g.48635  ORF Transcript_30365/g.48635 Transcript_30365/m.48635 type:complete len:412 (+) Transcript_30365:120-1355(+)
MQWGGNASGRLLQCLVIAALIGLGWGLLPGCPANLAVAVGLDEPDAALSLLHAQATPRKARASLDADLPESPDQLDSSAWSDPAPAVPSEDAEVVSPVPGPAAIEAIRTGSSASSILNEAAMAAAELALAEETAASRQAGGADTSASSDFDSEDEEAVQLLETRLELHAERAGLDIASGMLGGQFAKVGRLGEYDAHQEAWDQAALGEGSGNSSLTEPFGQPSGGNWSSPFGDPFTNPLSAAGGHSVIWWLLVVLATVSSVICIGVCCCGLTTADDSDSEDESDDGLGRFGGRTRDNELINELLMDRTRPNRFCCWSLCGCCSQTVLLFVAATGIITLVGGGFLWQLGILQPVLVQLLMYCYVMSLIIGFALVLAWEATATMRLATAVVFEKISSIDGVFNPFKKRGRPGP